MISKILRNRLFWLFALIGGLTFLLMYFALAKHYSFNSTIYDLGIFENTIWNSSMGRFFQTSISPAGNFLGYHSSFFLLFIVPVYKIFPFTETLLFLQSLFLMLPAWPIYLIAKEKVKSENISFAIAFCYLLFPAVHYAGLHDFHGIVFTPFFILFAFFFLENKQYYKYFIFLFLSLCIKEEIALLGVVFALYLFIKKEYKVALLTFFVSFSWFLFAVYWLIPFFAERSYVHIANKYGDIGSSLTDILAAFFTKPLVILDTILMKAKGMFVWKIFLPLGFLPFLGWQIFLPFLPIFVAYHLLSTSTKGLYSITSHYVPFSVSLIFIALILAFFNLRRADRLKKYIYIPAFLIVLLSIFSFLIWSPYPFSKAYEEDINFKKVVQDETIQEIREIIPERAILSVENNIGPHFIKRKKIYMFPKIENAEYVLVDSSNFRFNSREERERIYIELSHNSDFELIFSEKTLELYKRI